MSLPKDVRLHVLAGDAYQHIATYVDDAGDPIDLSGETITMKIYSKSTLLITLTEGSGLTISALAGQITIDLTGAQTDTLDGLPDRRYVLRLDDIETTIMWGVIDVSLPV